MKIDYDLIVVGAGPAGCAAAIKAAQAGLRVLIAERFAQPRHRPGETLHPGIEPLFQQLDLEDLVRAKDFFRFMGQWVEDGQQRAFKPFGTSDNQAWMGFQASGQELDSLMLEKTIDLGVTLLQPCRGIKPILKDNRVVGIRWRHGELGAHFVIDASGRAHWLQRKLNLPMRHFSPPLFVRYGYGYSQNNHFEQNPLFRISKDDWTWFAPLGGNRFNWTHLKKTGAVDKQPPSLPKDLVHVGPVRGADVRWRAVSQLAVPGAFMVGDAAWVLDPSSSHGVLKAIMSGIQAASLVIECLVKNAEPLAVLIHYHHWLEKWFFHDMRELKKFLQGHWGVNWGTD